MCFLNKTCLRLRLFSDNAISSVHCSVRSLQAFQKAENKLVLAQLHDRYKTLYMFVAATLQCHAICVCDSYMKRSRAQIT